MYTTHTLAAYTTMMIGTQIARVLQRYLILWTECAHLAPAHTVDTMSSFDSLSLAVHRPVFFVAPSGTNVLTLSSRLLGTPIACWYLAYFT